MDLGRAFSPDPLSRYPHMLFEDAGTWTRFLTANKGSLEKVWYDVHVGKAVVPEEGSPGFLQAVADGVTRKRIDVVALQAGRLLVIEVKPFCSMVALGQAVVYRELFEKEYGSDPRSLGCIVCDQVDEDVAPIAVQLGIKVLSTGFKVM